MPQDEKLIFDAAVEIDDAEKRARYLETECGADAQLRERVQSLLNAAKDCGGFLQRRAADSFEVRRDSIKADRIGESVGRYKLLEKIGEGGFGDVYMAEQQDPVSRRVALKIIKPGMDSSQVIARFEAERQALALMEHPNIGKFLDAGATDAGRPYFVMELVRGTPVTDYCQARRLSTEERLELFIEICAAVEHAHQKGIIHRDIKPTNILVYNNGQRPVPKVIDFGIAKATQGRLTDKTLFTQFHQFIGTPAYMSPEQAQMSGVDVDTRSDIYSLGVLLYELLTGTTPLDLNELQRQGVEETCRRIRDEDAPIPSKRVSTLTQAERISLADSHRTAPSDVVSRLRRDLDWIVMKALEKDRTRRYKTTDALASDIQLHLNHEPVTAGPPSTAYHLRKFVRRNRTAVLTTLAFATVLLLGIVVSIVGWARAVTAKRDLAAQVVETQEALAASNESQNQARAAMRQANSDRALAIKNAYLADIQSAFQALQLNNLGLARKLLKATADLDPHGELRGWEWRALWKRCRGNAEYAFQTGKGIGTLSVHRNAKWVAVGGVRSLRVLNIFDGSVVKELPCVGHPHVHFSSGGELLYTVDDTGIVRIWQVPGFEPTGATLQKVEQPKFDAYSNMHVSPDETRLITYSGKLEGIITIWDLQSGAILKEIATGSWSCPIAITPDSSTAILDGRLKVNLETLEVDEQPVSEEKTTPKYSPDGIHVAYISGESCVIRRVADGQLVTVLRNHDRSIESVAFSNDGKTLATGSSDGLILLWDMATCEQIAALRGHDLAVTQLAFLSDEQHLVSTGRAGDIYVWDLNDVANDDWPISRNGLHDWNTFGNQVSRTYDGRYVATTHGYGSPAKTATPGISLLSPNDLREVTTIAESSGRVYALLCSPTDDLIAICNERGALELIDASEGRITRELARTKDLITLPTQFTPDGEHLLVTVQSSDRTARISADIDRILAVYFIPDGKLIASWSAEKVVAGAISPDGKTVVTTHPDGMRFWSVSDPDSPPTHVVTGGVQDNTPGLLWSAQFSPDGRYVVAGGNLTGRIEIVDAVARRPVGYLAGHAAHVMAFCFSRDGKRLASAGSARQEALKLWDFEARREITTLVVDGAWSGSKVEWLPDGNSIMLVTGDSLLNIWRVPSFAEIELLEQ